MADRTMFISWGANVAGREERGLEVFNEAVGMYGRMQGEGRIESFDICLLVPNGGIQGYIAVHGSAAQIAAVTEDEEYQRNMFDANMVVHGLAVAMGYTNEGVAKQIELYQDSIAKVPQSA